MDDDRIAEPFHPGELLAQARAGHTPRAAIRDRMPNQHRDFFPLLPFLCVAVADNAGWPIASLLTGAPGFVSAPSANALHIRALAAADDPALTSMVSGADIGLLGIDLATRRRNRANGRIRELDIDGIAVDVTQSFGNCPKYIAVRQLAHEQRPGGPVSTCANGLIAAGADIIRRAQTAFVATASGTDVPRHAYGLDISHRGGHAGFITVEDNLLTVPDYPGNRYYNTLGNLLLEPRMAMIIPDFATGDLLQLQGVASIRWQPGLRHDPLAERSWTIKVHRSWLRPAAFPFRDITLAEPVKDSPAVCPLQA